MKNFYSEVRNGEFRNHLLKIHIRLLITMFYLSCKSEVLGILLTYLESNFYRNFEPFRFYSPKGNSTTETHILARFLCMSICSWKLSPPLQIFFIFVLAVLFADDTITPSVILSVLLICLINNVFVLLVVISLSHIIHCKNKYYLKSLLIRERTTFKS